MDKNRFISIKYLYMISTRCQGVGHALLGELERLAKESGINQYALDSWTFDENTHRFFEKLGFITYNMNMRRKTL
jgi:GNAT superfamily N-acetyltransferase